MLRIRDTSDSGLDDLKEAMEMNCGHQSDQHPLVDPAKRILEWDANLRIKPLEVLRSLLPSSHPDTLIVIMDTKEAEPDISWQPTLYQIAGLGSHLR
ncbi:hypothetical protein VZT92_016320 [Zoarces viviparus]